MVQAPFIMRDENSPKGFKGYCIDLIDEIAKIVNFDYDIKVVEDGKFGDMVKIEIPTKVHLIKCLDLNFDCIFD